jgi:hypothetical protein
VGCAVPVKKERQRFFFEKKNQKTFGFLGRVIALDPVMDMPRTSTWSS